MEQLIATLSNWTGEVELVQPVYINAEWARMAAREAEKQGRTLKAYIENLIADQFVSKDESVK